MSLGPSSPTSISFEQLLGWIGRFTPQFKFRLMAYRRQVAPAAFETLVRDALGVFRSVMVDLARTPKGPERARKVFALIDEEYRVTPVAQASCAAGCAACCSFSKQITDDEADLLASLVQSGAVTVDLENMREQLRSKEAKAPCPFLDGENRCRVYADRPSVCRKYHVTSPREACSSDEGAVVPRIDMMPELIVSAALSLPDNDIGPLSEQLLRRLG